MLFLLKNALKPFFCWKSFTVTPEVAILSERSKHLRGISSSSCFQQRINIKDMRPTVIANIKKQLSQISQTTTISENCCPNFTGAPVITNVS